MSFFGFPSSVVLSDFTAGVSDFEVVVSDLFAGVSDFDESDPLAPARKLSSFDFGASDFRAPGMED